MNSNRWHGKSRSMLAFDGYDALRVHYVMGLSPNSEIAGCACAENAAKVFPATTG